MLLFVAGLILAYGVFCVFWADKARRHFVGQYDLTSPLKWYNPSTWLRNNPTIAVFRAVGILLIGLAGILLWAWAHRQ